MTDPAPMIRPAIRHYSGHIPRPERWATYKARRGDVIVSTPSKSGTTWTQTMVAMLLNGGSDLPMKLPVLSPWIDADLGMSAAEVSANLEAQTGRRVLKTHTPLDGFPIWDGVTVITVYRHPLDTYFSLRKHYANMTITQEGDQMLQPLDESIRAFLSRNLDREDYNSKTLDSIATHYRETRQSDREPAPAMLHYSDLIADSRRAVSRLAEIAGIEADTALIDSVAQATSFNSMKAKAEDFAPAGGTGLFHSDSDFFDSAKSQKWLGKITEDTFELYETRLAELIPDSAARDWLQDGDRSRTAN